jgi:hypothetical protein
MFFCLEFIAVSGNLDESSQCKRLLKTLNDCLILTFYFLLGFLAIFKLFLFSKEKT